MVSLIESRPSPRQRLSSRWTSTAHSRGWSPSRDSPSPSLNLWHDGYHLFVGSRKTERDPLRPNGFHRSSPSVRTNVLQVETIDPWYTLNNYRVFEHGSNIWRLLSPKEHNTNLKNKKHHVDIWNVLLENRFQCLCQSTHIYIYLMSCSK